uniref:Protein kinase domain containing protein-2 n=1 Tax=Oryza meyeriana var. granulata TaxID=110450 RepID=B9V0K4_9ORYZ|nr:protein kinase domain containing protein-2 [Oryza meyeriana var. granulata]
MCRLSHPHMLRLHKVLAMRARIYLVMELATGGDLLSRLAALPMRPPVHGGACRRTVVQLVDRTSSSTTTGTSRAYNGAKADVWSYGVILFVLLAGQLPFDDSNIADMCRKAHCHEYELPRWVSQQARRLVSRLLDSNPDTCVAVESLATYHPWFKRSLSVDSQLNDFLNGQLEHAAVQRQQEQQGEEVHDDGVAGEDAGAARPHWREARVCCGGKERSGVLATRRDVRDRSNVGGDVKGGATANARRVEARGGRWRWRWRRARVRCQPRSGALNLCSPQNASGKRRGLQQHKWVSNIVEAPSNEAIGEYLDLWDAIQGIELQLDEPDKRIWKMTGDGRFTVESTYNLFFMARTGSLCGKADLANQGTIEG